MPKPAMKQPANKSTPKKTSVAKLLKQKALDPNLTYQQLAAINGVSKQAVSQMFKRYGINENYLESFKSHRSDILAGIQETALQTLTEADIKACSVRDRAVLFGVLFDKERLERNLSTDNISTRIARSVRELADVDY